MIQEIIAIHTIILNQMKMTATQEKANLIISIISTDKVVQEVTVKVKK